MIEFILELESIGLLNPTTVRHEDKVLTTQGLDVKTLSDLWKWYFHIPPYCKIILEVPTKLYYSMRQNTVASHKSVQELFMEQDIYIREKK